MSPVNLVRPVQSISYPASNARGRRDTIELPRTALTRRLLIHLYGTLTITTGAGTFSSEGHSRLIQQFDVVSNGNQRIKEFPGATLRKLNHLDYGTFGADTADATTTHEIDLEWVIPFVMPAAIRPFDTILKPGQFSLLELGTRWGDENDLIISGLSGTWDFSDLTLEVGVEEALPSRQQRQNLRSGLYYERTFSREYTSASGLQEPIRIPPTDFLRNIVMKWLVSSDIDDTGIDFVTLRSGAQDIYRRLGWGDTGAAAATAALLRTHDRFLGPNRGLIRDSAGNTWDGMAGDTAGGDGGGSAGYRVLDFTRDGMLSEMINAEALKELLLEVELASGTSGVLELTRRGVASPEFLQAAA